MALIDGTIAEQAYEVVRERIGLILATELESQVTAFGNYEADAEVWIERLIPFGNDEMPAINVQLAQGTFDNQTVKQTDGTYTFHIDVHQSAKTIGKEKVEQADYLALIKLQRKLGLCRAIISDARYVTLNFARPFIMYRSIKSMNIANRDAQDVTMSVWGRLALEVRVPEVVNLLNLTDLALYETSVKLFETDQGYVFRTNVV